MPRLISFALTTDQVRRREKRVTRRLGWKNLKPGVPLTGVVKAMGLKKGERPQKIAEIVTVDVRREPLDAMEDADCELEGFPDLTAAEFIQMFCNHYGSAVTPQTEITRIEFDYLDEPPADPCGCIPRQRVLFD